jgi:hypothetical protein
MVLISESLGSPTGSSEQAGDDFGNLFRRGRRRESAHDVAVSIHEELLEIPGDVGAVTLTRLCCLEHLIELGSPVAVDLDLGEHREVDVELRRDELEDLLIGSGLLSSELVARKTEDLDLVELVMQRTQTCVLRGEASSAGDIDNEEHLATELVEVDLLARDARHLEVIDR